MHRINPFRVFTLLPKIVLASAIMAACAYSLLLAGSHIIVILVVSAAVYLAALWLMKEKLVTDLRTQVRAILG
jgi:O-antigen/teichoic acid export membrane protein